MAGRRGWEGAGNGSDNRGTNLNLIYNPLQNYPFYPLFFYIRFILFLNYSQLLINPNLLKITITTRQYHYCKLSPTTVTLYFPLYFFP